MGSNFRPNSTLGGVKDEGQQEEAKRPKSPEREGVQLAEQHGSGGEGGEEMEIERQMNTLYSWEIETEEQLDKYVHAICIRST